MSSRLFETPPRTSRLRAGMTLVEVMVSLVILAFGLLGVAALQVRAITESSGGEHLTTASEIARNRVEELNRLTWNNVVSTGGAWSADTVVADPDGTSALTFIRAQRITDDIVAPNTTIKSIEVRVGWSDNKRQNRFVVLASARLKEVDE